MEVFVNSVPANFINNGGIDKNISDSVGCVFNIIKMDELGGNTVIEIKLHEEAVLKFAQIVISEKE